MQKRLISQNILQCPNQTIPQFTSFGCFIAYKTDNNNIKIKTFNKDIRQLQIKVNNKDNNNNNNNKQRDVIKYLFTTFHNKIIFIIQYNDKIIDIYQLQIKDNQIKYKIFNKLQNVKQPILHKTGLIYISQQKYIKIYIYQNNSIHTICQTIPNSTIIQHQGQSIYILSPIQIQIQNSDIKILRIYNNNNIYKNSSIIYQQSTLNIDYINNPLIIYKDQYIFQQNKANKQIQIFNINISKIVGKFNYQGQLSYANVKGNILLLVTSKENMDRYCFYTLNPNVIGNGNGQQNNNNNSNNSNKSILSHRSVYQKGKGSYYQTFSCNQQLGEYIIQGKVNQFIKYIDKIHNNNNSNNNDQTILLYVQPIKKNKIQLLRISSSKIREQTFKQNQMDTIILCKTQTKQKGVSQKKLKIQAQNLEIQKARIGTSMNHRKSQKPTIQEMQKKLIDHIVDIKIRGLMDKFQQLQRRLISIEDQISIIYKKIQRSLESINRQQIKNNVQKLFDRVTPQFQSYFKQVFRQISGVLDQGLTYYSTKLSKQSEIHRDAFNQVINMTFDAAQQIVQLGRKELNHSQKTSSDIQKLLQIRKKWQTQTQQLTDQFKPPKNSIEAKGQINLNSGKLSPDKKTSPEQTKKKN